MAETFSVTAGEAAELSDGYEVVSLGSNDLMSVGHLHFEPGASIPEHSHPHQQIGFIYEGELTFYVDGEPELLEPGDGYVLAGNEPHRGENEGDVPVNGVFVHSPPRAPVSWNDEHVD